MENPFRVALERFGPNGKGWCKDTSSQIVTDPPYTEVYRQFCASGALVEMGYELENRSAAIELLRTVIGEQFPEYKLKGSIEVSIPSWNDATDRTFEDVRMIFEKCAIRWEEEHG